MNTSTTPVREAFRLLASEGLVKIEPWKGVVVQEYSTDEILEVFQCRQVLETLALDLTISRMERLPNREEELRRIEEDIALSEGEDAYSGFVGRNSGIHNFWIKGSGNRRLLLLMENLNDVLLHDRNMSAMDEKRREEIIAEHREIFRAVRVLDREGARAALTRHMENGYQYSLKIRNQED
jgi:Transcriptional regulators